MNSYARIGIFGILALIALRVGVGWHFYMEGATKVRGNDFSSVGFLNGAKGPLAGQFQALIWDHDGQVRLDQERVVGLFSAGADDAAKHFTFTAEQSVELQSVTKQYSEKLKEVYAAAADEIYKYQSSQERIAKMDNSAMYQVASLRGQKEKVQNELLASVKPTLAAVEAIWDQFELRLNNLANPTQRKAAGVYVLVKPGQGPLSTAAVDKIIPIFDMVVGILLMIGLLTPLAAIVAALFLLSVVLSQMPGYPGTQPTYFQAVECLALLLLAATDAGRYAGLDFIPWAWWNRARNPTTRPAPRTVAATR